VGAMPPLTGVAVKVMLLPWHIVVLGALMVTEGVTIVFTVMVKLFEVAVVGEAQETEEVSTQVKTSLFTIEVVVYVADVAPLMLLPFLLH
jgi:hypothetical protein